MAASSSSSALLSSKAIGSKRGKGACDVCHKEYTNRKKPKLCGCGHEIGGSFVEKLKNPSCPASVEIYNTQTSSFRSVKLTPNDDRSFVYVQQDNKICYAGPCKSSNEQSKISQMKFTCKHIEKDAINPVYQVSFSEDKIRSFTPDISLAEEMISVQNSTSLGPTVSKVSHKSYAVKSTVTTTAEMGFSHVMEVTNKRTKHSHLKCLVNECKRPKKKSNHTKTVSGKKVCVHLHLVILARQICEGIYDAKVEETDHDKKEVENENKTGASETPHYDSTVKKLMSNTIPYNIPPNVVRLSDQMVVPEQERLVFESKESVCSLCQGQLSESMYPQGCNSINGNGILITNTNPFIKIDIKIRKCRQSSCKAVHAPYLYEKGLFNVSNKVVVGLDILLEWREFFKDGMPVSNFIRCKLKALEKKTEKEHCLTSEEIEYLVKTLYNGFYAFEALTERNLDESICGICGIVGIVYYGDGNEKNCCTNKEINCSAKKETLLSSNKEETRLSSTKEDNELSSNKKETGQSSNKEETQLRNDNEVNLEETLLSMKDRLVRKMLFPNAAEENRFEIDLDNIPPIIPPKQRSHQFSTEMSKKSEYLKKSDVIEGDAMKLSRLITDEKLSIEDFDSMDVKELKRIASKCDIKQSGKSRALLKVVLQQLYASILVGRSACHQFVKSAGHTGGFYHFVCPHGTTVCSKLMILTESVRDAADLWLSLKYPPVMFICDTPCTFVQHVNKRKPDLAKKYWDDFDGCFEKPTLDKDPNSEMDVPNIVPIEFRDVAPIPMNPKNSNVHPITYKERRYVAGDRFHTGTNPHKSPLCEYHNVNLAQQGNTLKTSYQESMNNKKNKLRNRTSCTQGFLHHFYYNYLMNFYENEEIVSKQRRNLENMVSNTGKIVKRDEYSRFVVAE